MLYDNHLHIINIDTTPPEFAARRLHITVMEMKFLLSAAKTLRKIDWPDNFDAAVDIVDDVLKHSIPQYRRLRHLCALYFMSTEKQIQVLLNELRKNNVAGGNVLLLPGTPGMQIDTVIGLCRGTPLRVFAPPECAGIDGISGIKFYPSLYAGNYVENVAQIAEQHNLPIISHCSPGGVRLPSLSAALAQRKNAPAQWIEALGRHKIRLCLAHGGGDRWMRWLAGARQQVWSIDYMMREAHPPTDWAGRLWMDTAFHDDQATERYQKAVSRASAPWRVLWGSDWPLHLRNWSYSQACAWGRAYWGDQVAAQKEFLEGGGA